MGVGLCNAHICEYTARTYTHTRSHSCNLDAPKALRKDGIKCSSLPMYCIPYAETQTEQTIICCSKRTNKETKRNTHTVLYFIINVFRIHCMSVFANARNLFDSQSKANNIKSSSIISSPKTKQKTNNNNEKQ